MSRKRRVLVTGVSRWWGALTVQRLLQHHDVGEVVGIDTADPHHDLGSADFVRVDIRHSLIGKLVRSVGIDTVVHTQTTIDSMDPDSRRAHETNVIGTMNLLAGCAGDDSPVKRLVLKSSAHVYGARHDLPGHLREERRLDTASPHSFVRDMIETESNFVDFAIRNPAATTVLLRFTNSLNSEEPAPLARYFDLPLVPTVLGYDPLLHLIHREDVVEALVRAALGEGSGAYNIAGPNPLPLTALLAGVGKVGAPLLPPAGLQLLAATLAGAGLTFLSPQLVDLLRWGRTLNLQRAERDLGFRAARDTMEALDDYVQQRRVIGYLPGQGQYIYERELEDYIHSRRQRGKPTSVGRLKLGADAAPAASEPLPRPRR